MNPDYALRPPSRVSFATHDRDVDAAWKAEVLERVRLARWNTYVGLDGRWAAEDFVERLGIEARGGRRASVHRGAEAALKCLIEHRAPERLWVPAHGYPGFARVASACRIPLLTYAVLDDVARSRRGDLVVITTPSSPVETAAAGDLVRAVEGTGAERVIDATFSLLDPVGVAGLEHLLSLSDAPVIVSASKSLGLAGIRLGVLLDGGPGPHVMPNPMELDVFQCAVWDAFMDGDNLRRRAHDVGTRQRKLHHRLRRAIERLEAEVMYASNSFAITVRRGSVPVSALGDHGWKEYPPLHALRLDASDRVAAAIEAWTGAP
ncbi:MULTISPECIES: aminotransferase class I/II-fold pyridoxal phosphate-dependent enzyme [Microbacterium]|uniref:Aminotransferase class I/II-fold pyridoxal phosphate-dependent enzyme n=1 Tax=Microbacterium plantarum TaxID=1816425 RepID=A0ABV5EP49_9MICO|nr:aminotransferase class I/II-fold pyridoxal phosphate-dependent enzyme [Microbacterium arborescens]